MAIRNYKPTTPGRRGSSVADFAEITRSTPEKSLLRPLPKTGGRNNTGRITTRHIGGGHKRQYRVIDFKRNDKDGVDAKVAQVVELRVVAVQAFDEGFEKAPLQLAAGLGPAQRQRRVERQLARRLFAQAPVEKVDQVIGLAQAQRQAQHPGVKRQGSPQVPYTQGDAAGQQARRAGKRPVGGWRPGRQEVPRAHSTALLSLRDTFPAGGRAPFGRPRGREG